MKKSAGFTLIELLVAISIIALLAAIVLTASTNSRLRAKDSHIIADTQQARLALHIGFVNPIYTDLYSVTANSANTVGSLTTNGPDFAALTSIQNDAVAEGGSISFRIQTNSTVGNATTPNTISYIVYGQLASSPTKYFCIDSTGGTNQATSSNSYITCN